MCEPHFVTRYRLIPCSRIACLIPIDGKPNWSKLVLMCCSWATRIFRSFENSDDG